MDENVYYEKHHIWPKSLDGLDIQNNIISLTAREHFIAHKLLYKITKDIEKRKMSYALWRMVNSKIKITSSFEYENIRRIFKNNMTGENHPRFGKHHTQETKDKISKSKTNPSIETRNKISKANTNPSIETRNKMSLSHIGNKYRFGKQHTQETKDKISNTLKDKYQNTTHHMVGIKTKDHPWYDKQHTQETKDKISKALKGKKKRETKCPHCSKIGSISNMKRWHFDNCKIVK